MANMADTIPARLHWADGRVETMPDGVDATANEVQVQTPAGRYCTFRETDEIDDEGFAIYVQVVT